MISAEPKTRPNGVPQLHQVRIAEFANGERFPVVLCRDGTPHIHAAAFIVEKRHLSPKRLAEIAAALASTLDLLSARAIEIDARAEIGDTLAPHEVLDLREHLRMVGPRTVAIRERVASATGEPAVLHVGPVEWLNRILAAKEFLIERLRAATYRCRTDARTHDALTRQIERVGAQFSRNLPLSRSTPREGLEPEQYSFYGKAIDPQYPANPFSEGKRWANFPLLATFKLLGLRAGEPRLLRLGHLISYEGRPAIRLAPNADEKTDTRRARASLKRGARKLFVPRWYAGLLEGYVDGYRRDVGKRLMLSGNEAAYRNYLAHDYVFVSERGSPISKTSVYNLFVKLRTTFPDDLPSDLGPARLRNSWNDSLFDAGAECDIDLSDIAEHSMGWLAGSPMQLRYANKGIARATGDWLEARSRVFDGIFR
jgi:hypothetical protein